jgi:radical SAM superfamily enzyme YgiQ (UPF0313 family)
VDDVENALTVSPNAQYVQFKDDLFILNFNRLKQIHTLWLNKKIHKKLKMITVSVVPKLFTEDTAKILKEMNTYSVRMGIETLSPKLQGIINKFNLEEDVQRVIDLCLKWDIKLNCNFMCGLPTENLNDLLLTYKFIMKNKNKITYTWFKFVPLPGCDMYAGASPFDLPMTILRDKKYVKTKYIKQFFSCELVSIFGLL